MNIIRVLGIDPGLRFMGWGVIELCGSKLRYVASGRIITNAKLDLASRLAQLYQALDNIVKEYLPQQVGVEHVFVNKDAVDSLKLSQARAVALLVPALYKIPVAEYAPNKVKKSVIGVGHGQKQQIQMMVKMLLPLAQFDSPDEADALAVAICHAHNIPVSIKISEMHNLGGK